VSDCQFYRYQQSQTILLVEQLLLHLRHYHKVIEES
jgi:hypothetical protein